MLNHALDRNVDSNCVHATSDSEAPPRLVHGRRSRRQRNADVLKMGRRRTQTKRTNDLSSKQAHNEASNQTNTQADVNTKNTLGAHRITQHKGSQIERSRTLETKRSMHATPSQHTLNYACKSLPTKLEQATPS